MIVGVVLAAGKSLRMGRAKPLMQWQGKTWIAHAVDRMRDAGCDDVVAVVSDPAVALESGARNVEVVQTHLGMLHSVQCAVTACPAGQSFLICPCDMPAIASETVSRIASATRADALVVPEWNRKRGHPIGIGADLVKKIVRMDARRYGLNRLLKDESVRLTMIPVDDPACVVDFDTPEEWMRFSNSRKDGRTDG